MSKISEFSEKIKFEIKQMYLSGMPTTHVAERFGVNRRTIYHHLKPLTPEDKVQHIKAMYARSK